MSKTIKLPFGLFSLPADAHPTFHNVLRNVPHSGVKHEYSGFMDDFGFLVKVDYQKLALALSA